MGEDYERQLPPANKEDSSLMQNSFSQHIPRGLQPYSLQLFGEVLDGSLCPTADDLAQQLARHLLQLYEEHPCLLQSVTSEADGTTASAPGYNLEIEGRLGVLREIQGKSRLQIPTTSHTVLAPAFCRGGTRGVDGSGGGWVHFDAGVTSQQFSDLRAALLEVVSRRSKACHRQMQLSFALMGEEIRDESYDMEDDGSATEYDSTGCKSVVEESVHHENGGDTSGVGRGIKGIHCDDSDTATAKRRRKVSSSCPAPQLRGNDWTVLPVRESEEVYFRVEAIDASARFTSLKQSSGSASIHPSNLANSLASPGIYKKNIVQWNIYTGADKEDAFRTSTDLDGSSAEDIAKSKLDYRLALNFENNIDVKDLQRALLERSSVNQGRSQYSNTCRPGSVEPQLRRLRARQSLVHRSGLRVDLTRVVQQQTVQIPGSSDSRRGYQQQTLYEVEVELHPSQVARAVIHRQKTGDPRPLWCLCVSFLAVLRELSVFINSSEQSLGVTGDQKGGGAANFEFADLRDVQPTESERQDYKYFFGDTLPLIGDYAYRAVAQGFREKNQGQTTDSAIVDNEFSLTVPVLSAAEFFKSVDINKKSLYTHNKNDISGPWLPHRDQKGRVHLIEFKTN